MLLPYVSLMKHQLGRTYMELVEWREERITDCYMSQHPIGVRQFNTNWNYDTLSQRVADFYNEVNNTQISGN